MLNFLFLHPLIHTQMLTIYLIRHGETIENCSGILQGCTPGRLNKKGEEQIKALSDRLGGLKFDAFVSSDLKRALDSAAIINKKFNLPIDLCPLLRERDWGSLTGMSYTEAKKLDVFPNDVETQEHGCARAVEFLNTMIIKYDGKTILAMGHGFINRCVLSAVYGIPKSEVQRMDNGECRIFSYENTIELNNSTETDEVSAN